MRKLFRYRHAESSIRSADPSSTSHTTDPNKRIEQVQQQHRRTRFRKRSTVNVILCFCFIGCIMIITIGNLLAGLAADTADRPPAVNSKTTDLKSAMLRNFMRGKGKRNTEIAAKEQAGTGQMVIEQAVTEQAVTEQAVTEQAVTEQATEEPSLNKADGQVNDLNIMNKNKVEKVENIVEEVEQIDNVFPAKYIGSSLLDTQSYRPPGGKRFKEWMDGSLPYNITQETRGISDERARERREHVKNAMKHAWHGYKTNAFGADEVRPVTGGPKNHWGGLGTTLVDALDTLWLMDMKDEFYEARDWVKDHLDFNKNIDVSVFETTIRSLGGLLSAYDWSGEDIFLEKATDLGDRLVKAFDVTNGIPRGQVNLQTGRSSSPAWLNGKIILADAATLAVEFRQLSKHTKNEQYAQKAEHIFHTLKGMEPANGLFPYFLESSSDGTVGFQNNEISFGPYGDSFYEYQLKIWLQGDRKEDMYREMYDRSMDGMHHNQLQESNGLTFINFGHDRKRMDHLTCFMGGLLALGAWTDPKGFKSDRAQRDLKTARAMAYTCYQMYSTTPTGLAADIVQFNPNIIPYLREKAYKLRPETVESLFILNKITGDPIYREWGWEIFQSIEKYCRTDIAYGKVGDVYTIHAKAEDDMESFFLGETLKYLYLLFDPDSELDLEKYVFNTEAHPVRIK